MASTAKANLEVPSSERLKIFLTYTTRDAFLASVVQDILESLGAKIATHEHISFGSKIGAPVARAIEDADAVVVLTSGPSRTDGLFVSEEMAHASRSGTANVVLMTGRSTLRLEKDIGLFMGVRLKEVADPIQGLNLWSQEIADVYARIQDRIKNGRSSAALNSVPVPGAGIHIELDAEGLLSFAPPTSLDAHGNNRRRLDSLHPEIRELAGDLSAALGKSNAYPNLAKLAARYSAIVSNELDDINFSQLFALGIRLSNSAAAAQRAMTDEGYPSFSLELEEALQSLLTIHGPFVMASKDGLELLDIEERLKLTPSEVQRIHDAGMELGRRLSFRPDLATPELAEVITQTASAIGESTNLARGNAVGYGTVRNAVVAITASASAAVLPAAGEAIAGSVGGVAGTAAMLIGYEAIKKSKAFMAISGPITAGLNELSHGDLERLQKRFMDYLNFVLESEDTLQELAMGGEDMAWINRVLRALRALKG